MKLHANTVQNWHSSLYPPPPVTIVKFINNHFRTVQFISFVFLGRSPTSAPLRALFPRTPARPGAPRRPPGPVRLAIRRQVTASHGALEAQWEGTWSVGRAPGVKEDEQDWKECVPGAWSRRDTSASVLQILALQNSLIGT